MKYYDWRKDANLTRKLKFLNERCRRNSGAPLFEYWNGYRIELLKTFAKYRELTDYEKLLT